MIEIELTQPSFLCKSSLNVWNNPDFMQTVADISDLKPYHLVCYKGESVVSCLPLYEKKVFGRKICKHPLLSYYQGLNLWLEDNSAPARRLLDALQITQTIAKYLSCRYKVIRHILSPETYDVRGFLWNNMQAIPSYTFIHNFQNSIIPLSDERKKITLAEKQDYTFEEEMNIEEFIHLMQLMNVKKRWQPGLSYQDLADFIRILHTAGILRQLNLKKDGRIVSSNIILQDCAKAYTIFRATEIEALKKGASSLHTVKLIEFLKQENLEELDFCGANVSDIARFKAAMDLQLKVFFQIRTTL